MWKRKKKKKARFHSGKAPVELDKKIVLDLSGPEGNAFYILGCAKRWCNQLDLNWVKIHDEMTEDDFDHLVDVFEHYFGDFVTVIR